jgi:integrase
MARRKRQYGSGCILETKGGIAIRWRELELAPNGTLRRVLRYETLGQVSRKRATQILAERLAAAGGRTPARSLVTFGTVANQWLKIVLPMYKTSTQKNHRHIVEKHLRPRFGEDAMSAVTRQSVQAYIATLTESRYAPKTVDHIHDVLSAILRTAVDWQHLPENPARGVRLPKLRTVRPKWVLTIEQGAALLNALAPLPRTLAGLAILSGVRRGELFALRWKDVDEQAGVLRIREAVYEGSFGTPKTEASRREIPLSEGALQFLKDWKGEAAQPPETLVFATRSGKPISPNNVLRRWIFPTCTALGLRRATWLTFRRTYSTWAHEQGVPSKIVAMVMGHAKVDTTLNVYTQVRDESVRAAVAPIGAELFKIVQSQARASELIH